MYHVPIMLNQIADALKIYNGGTYFDGTLGGGGHSEEILKRGGAIIGVDRDQDAIEECRKRFGNEAYKGRYTLIKENFKNAKTILNGISLDGALLDLGISSHQIDLPERGMSYRFDSELDMRMDKSQYLNAKIVLNEYSEQDLVRILFEYGEERFAKRIVKNILAFRQARPLETTGELVEIIKKSVPFTDSHPAKKTFQAIRIEVNNELRGLDNVIKEIFNHLKGGARLCVIAFHSLEDRIVKKVFSELSQGCICDKSLPQCVCGHKSQGKLIDKIKAGEQEVLNNPRSSSATLRIIERLSENQAIRKNKEGD